jgi:hypothetical protein
MITETTVNTQVGRPDLGPWRATVGYGCVVCYQLLLLTLNCLLTLLLLLLLTLTVATMRLMPMLVLVPKPHFDDCVYYCYFGCFCRLLLLLLQYWW